MVFQHTSISPNLSDTSSDLPSDSKLWIEDDYEFEGDFGYGFPEGDAISRDLKPSIILMGQKRCKKFFLSIF